VRDHGEVAEVLLATRKRTDPVGKVLLVGSGSVTQALLAVLPGLGFEVAEASPSELPEVSGGVGVASALSPEELPKALALSASLGATGLVIVGGHGVVKDALKTRMRRLEKQRNLFLKEAPWRLWDVVAGLRSFTQIRGSLARSSLTGYANAKNLWALLARFSHNSKSDLGNQFLGPVVMLLRHIEANQNLPKRARKSIIQDVQALTQNISETWNVFISQVVDVVDNDKFYYGELGSEIVAAARDLSSDMTSTEVPKAANVEHLMDLMTECRISAGEKTPGFVKPTGSKGKPVNRLRCRNEPYRVLVVDDFAQHWRPVLHVVKRLLAEGSPPLNVEFTFSVDGERVLRAARDNQEFWSSLPDHDMVVLDIFLGDRFGLEVLAKIRSRHRWLPVLLWTTSREAELPALASLANGFIFKKNATCQQIREQLAAWLPEGRARRLLSLGHPFFDEQIRDQRRRGAALAFQQWSLTQVDAFHALDPKFFRNFTDHGGRHMQGVLNRLQELLRPLLWRDDVFGSSPDEREKDILRLYLGALFHEIGMLPFEGRWAENYSTFNDHSFHVVRKQHGIRGMLRLFCRGRRGDGLHQLVEVLGEQSDTTHWVAALAAYHTRLLSLDASDFLRLSVYEEQVLESLKDDPGSVPISCVGWGLESVKRRFEHQSELIERLRKHCAILRFADAIDMDRSRNPANPIRLHESVKPENRREYLKRDVIEEVVISRGTVEVYLDAPCPTNENEWETPFQLGGKEREQVDSELNNVVNELFVKKQSWDQNGLGRAAQLAAVSAMAEVAEEYKAINAVGLGESIRLGRTHWKKKETWSAESISSFQLGENAPQPR